MYYQILELQSFDAAQNKDHKCNEMHNKILCYYHDFHRPIIQSYLNLYFSTFELVALVDRRVSMCSCREVTGVGTGPQPSLSHTGTADAAGDCVLLCPYLPWTMTPLPSSGCGHSLLIYMTKMIL